MILLIQSFVSQQPGTGTHNLPEDEAYRSRSVDFDIAALLERQEQLQSADVVKAAVVVQEADDCLEELLPVRCCDACVDEPHLCSSRRPAAAAWKCVDPR